MCVCVRVSVVVGVGGGLIRGNITAYEQPIHRFHSINQTLPTQHSKTKPHPSRHWTFAPPRGCPPEEANLWPVMRRGTRSGACWRRWWWSVSSPRVRLCCCVCRRRCVYIHCCRGKHEGSHTLLHFTSISTSARSIPSSRHQPSLALGRFHVPLVGWRGLGAAPGPRLHPRLPRYVRQRDGVIKGWEWHYIHTRPGWVELTDPSWPSPHSIQSRLRLPRGLLRPLRGRCAGERVYTDHLLRGHHHRDVRSVLPVAAAF